MSSRSRTNIYESALSGRYPSLGMRELWSDDNKFGLWRQMWFAIASAQKSLGVPITQEQLDEMQNHLQDPIDYERAAYLESELKHDVLAHIYTFGEACPKAAGIIHLGCTSCDITDNTDLILMRRGIKILVSSLAKVIRNLCAFAKIYRDLPIVGLTHLQPAQPTTLGKRVCMSIQDLLIDLVMLNGLTDVIPFRGIKGASGTQDSMLKIFNGDQEKVSEFEIAVAKQFEFDPDDVIGITGQTYSRKYDTLVMFSLSNFAASSHKFATDLRILQSRNEMQEPFDPDQKGSSAMPHKHNPMRCERICGLSRELMQSVSSALQTHSLQWMERTLDDSSARRRYIPESFLLADSILKLLANVTAGMIAYPAVIERNLKAEMPFLLCEEVILEMVKAGADRQECHKKLAEHARLTSDRIKLGDGQNDLVERLVIDPYFESMSHKLQQAPDPKRFTGLAAQQADSFITETENALRNFGEEETVRAADIALQV